MKRLISSTVLLALVIPVVLFAVDGKKAQYVGGTVTTLKEKAEGRMMITDETALVFTPDKKDSTPLSIPYASTMSYSELASAIGRPKASRAVGRASALNPIALVIPCHRVLGVSGSLTGYGGGMALKRSLLALEQGQSGLFED